MSGAAKLRNSVKELQKFKRNYNRTQVTMESMANKFSLPARFGKGETSIWYVSSEYVTYLTFLKAIQAVENVLMFVFILAVTHIFARQNWILFVSYIRFIITARKAESADQTMYLLHINKQ